MFINNVHRKEEIQNIAIQHLRKYGIKYRPKKTRPPQQVTRYGKKFFKVPLQNLETETVTLTNGQQLVIPKRIHEMCSYILSKVQTEGIFRKEGSKSRQNEIKLSLDRGCLLGNEHHVIDVAVVLKSFLRELPEPLIPQTYHELFLRCSIGENRLDAILLACLLLPSEHLNVLSYLMQFFHEVASFSSYNKMSFNNLSILVGPNIFPIDEKIVPKSSLMITKICDITKLLIENSKNIGLIPDNIIEQIGQLSDNENEKRRKNKRRSGSLTRMLNGLKKIVSTKVVEESCSSHLVTPDLLLTPTIHNVVKKRKGEGLSLKKRKEVVTKLPDCAILNTPFTPCRTPVSINPSGQRNMDKEDSVTEITKEKKMHWYMRSRSMKSLKEDESTTSSNSRRSSFGPRSLLERRWSAVSNAANFRKKKRNSCAATKKELIIAERNQAMKQQEPDYVRVPKSEYEDFKSRVSAIERRISLELDNVQSHIDNDNDNNVNREISNERDGNIESVQEAYQKTLENASLSPTTDQLARRLSRDLRIRRSAEQKIIRSPSARKIGTLRRRSTEREKKNARVVRNRSWHLGTSTLNNCTAPLIPRISMRRNKYTINHKENSKVNETPPTEILQPSPTTRSLPKSNGGRKTRNSLNRMQSSPYTFSVDTSFVNHKSPQQAYSVNLSESGLSYVTTGSSASNDNWVSAEGFFSASKKPQDGSGGNARASIAKLRSQNSGMVRAKARLFDNMKDSDTSCDSVISSRSQPGSGQKGTVCKNGSGRMAESTRMSYRIRTLRLEEKKAKKASLSPRRRQASVSHRQRLQNIGKQYVRGSRENSSAEVSQESIELTTPRKDLNSLENALSPKKSATLHNAPHIKMPLTARTPKRLCRTPAVNRRTPFKVVATPL